MLSEHEGEVPMNAPAKAGSFPTTHWSVVLHAGANNAPQARDALETLCRQYWYPLYSFVRRQGRTHHEAEDCTQEFLSRLLAAGGLARARPERGRFRTFLLTSLRNFLSNEWHRATATKRGGGQQLLSFDGQDADTQFALEPADPRLTPEQAFDRNWARGLIDRAFNDLRLEYKRDGRGAVFDALAPLAWGKCPGTTLPDQAAQLGMSTHAFTVALHRLRRRLGERLRAEVAETVADGADIDAELRHLITAVSAAGDW